MKKSKYQNTIQQKTLIADLCKMKVELEKKVKERERIEIYADTALDCERRFDY